MGPGPIDHFHEHGWAVVPDVLTDDQMIAAREQLEEAAVDSEAAGMPVKLEALDPGGCNIRVYDLVAHGPVFAELAAHPLVLDLVRRAIGDDVILSNFTANTALPGSRSMNPHCDQSTVMPEPWPEVWAMNAIWCLHDIDEDNGATRYLPGSHRFTSFADVPADPAAEMVPFEAPAGSVVLLHGRTWHTSGANTSDNRIRALLFAFYTRAFLRPQTNWWRTIPPERRSEMDPELLALLALDYGNLEHGVYLTS